MKILVSGSSGLIGSHLVPVLESKGHHVSRLVRRSTGGPTEVQWDPQVPPDVSGVDAVIHLAGESIVGRWTAEKKRRIVESRVSTTRNLANAIASAGTRPRAFLVASAVGYYGSRGDTLLTEDAPPGHDFLAQVVRDWEAACESAGQAGVRVANLRIGVVVTPEGGALKKMLPPFRLGAGGKVGSGQQWMSWIALDDVVGAIVFLLENESISGPVNLAAPNPVTNIGFTQALAQALHRPALFPMPAAVVKLVFGEMGEAILLGSQRVVPQKLQAGGYDFRYTNLGEALKAMLG